MRTGAPASTLRSLLALALLAIALAGSGCADIRAAANSVAPSRASNTATAITANALKPPECAALNLTAVVYGNGDFEGDTPNELLLGSSATQRLRGRDGNDCIVGGAGADEIRGDAGTDVCIGSATATFQDCETTVVR